MCEFSKLRQNKNRHKSSFERFFEVENLRIANDGFAMRISIWMSFKGFDIRTLKSAYRKILRGPKISFNFLGNNCLSIFTFFHNFYTLLCSKLEQYSRQKLLQNLGFPLRPMLPHKILHNGQHLTSDLHSKAGLCHNIQQKYYKYNWFRKSMLRSFLTWCKLG